MLELLIVVSVMVILLGIALPVMKTGVESRRLREGARQVNTCVELAKSLGVEEGLASAVYIPVTSLPEDTTRRYASRLFLAETPRPYSGDMANAKATVNGSQVTFGTDSASIGTLGIEAGDFIRFDYKGPHYVISSAITGLGPVGISGTVLPPSGQFSYQVFRKPQKSSSTPLELPAGTVVDLTSSGLGFVDPPSFRNAASSILIVFAPNGGVSRVYVDNVRTDPTQRIHFLVGNLDKLGDDNMKDATTLWVSINERSGRVTTAPNGGTESDFTVATAREFAESGQAMGGR
jgi:Tfp pilus assembly protein FimT